MADMPQSDYDSDCVRKKIPAPGNIGALRLKELIEARGFNPTQAAKICVIPQSTFHGYYTGKREMSKAVQHLIANALHVPPSFLTDPNEKLTIPKTPFDIRQWLLELRLKWVSHPEKHPAMTLGGKTLFEDRWPDVERWLNGDEPI
jgi:transcriptional regulator with XRE-family HTH domain